MRNIFLILIVVVIAAIIAIQAGLVSITQTRPATAPTVSASGGKVETQPGQAPAFEVETGTVAVGQQTRTVTVPTVSVQRPATNTPAN